MFIYGHDGVTRWRVNCYIFQLMDGTTTCARGRKSIVIKFFLRFPYRTDNCIADIIIILSNIENRKISGSFSAYAIVLYLQVLIAQHCTHIR